jgi:hypothetical protein
MGSFIRSSDSQLKNSLFGARLNATLTMPDHDDPLPQDFDIGPSRGVVHIFFQPQYGLILWPRKFGR